MRKTPTTLPTCTFRILTIADPGDVRRLHTDMMTFFTWAMADMQKTETHSKAVNECLDYIHYHLHEKITVAILAQHVHLNPTYLSELFARETGTSLSQYITDKRMEPPKTC